jgi:hypothetical protein
MWRSRAGCWFTANGGLLGTRSRDRLCGMSKVICVQGQQGLYCKASPGDAGADEHWRTAWSAATARPPSRPGGACSSILVARAAVRVPAYEGFRATAKGSLASCERQAKSEMYWGCSECGCRVAGVVVPERRWPYHALCWRTCDRRTGPGGRPRTERAHPIPPRHRPRQHQVLQEGSEGMLI